MFGSNFFLFIFICDIFVTNAWHSSINFNFKVDFESIKVNEMKVFQSFYLNRDYFSLLSSRRNNFLDDVDELHSVFIGAR